MILFYTGWYSVELVQSNRDVIFVYGDNSLGFGHGGQAVIRDQVNTLGVPTKWAPSNDEYAFYSDACWDRPLVRDRLGLIGRSLAAGKTVVIPGTYEQIELGTGLSQLPTRGPDAYAQIRNFIRNCADHFGVTTEALS